MTMVSLSVSHRATPVELLERLAVTPPQRGDLLARLHAAPWIDEALVLSTCNRVEVYAAAHGPTRQVIRTLADQLGAHRGVRNSDVRRAARVRSGAAVAEHLFSVACGLDSMAVGEEQIVSQVRDAARAAAAAGSTGPVLIRLVDAALRTSKRARTETRIGTEGISLVRAGLDLAAVQLGGLAGRDAVVLGTGTTGRLTTRLLRAARIGRVSVAGRSESRVAEVAAAVDGSQLRVDEVPGRLAETDILVTATGAATPPVRAAAVRAARAQAAARPLVVLDLGMPSDVDPAVGRLPGVTLIDLTALGRHLAERAAPDPVARVRAIVAEEAQSYVERHQQTAAAPVVAALHQQIGQIAATELARLQDRLPDFDEQQRAETAIAVHRILRKVLHQPTTRAKELAAGPDGPAYLAALSTLFDLDVTIAHPAAGSAGRW